MRSNTELKAIAEALAGANLSVACTEDVISICETVSKGFDVFPPEELTIDEGTLVEEFLDDAKRLTLLEAQFAAAGGRGVELADEIDRLHDMDDRVEDGPDEEDYVTEDHIKWYQHDKLVLTTADPADPHSSHPDAYAMVWAHMNREKFWPNVWFVSDHGNAHLISLADKWEVTARVRKRNAIGIFYSRRFEVLTEPDTKDEQKVQDAWFSQHGETWELNHFVSVTCQRLVASLRRARQTAADQAWKGAELVDIEWTEADCGSWIEDGDRWSRKVYWTIKDGAEPERVGSFGVEFAPNTADIVSEWTN